MFSDPAFLISALAVVSIVFVGWLFFHRRRRPDMDAGGEEGAVEPELQMLHARVGEIAEEIESSTEEPAEEEAGAVESEWIDTEEAIAPVEEFFEAAEESDAVEAIEPVEEFVEAAEESDAVEAIEPVEECVEAAEESDAVEAIEPVEEAGDRDVEEWEEAAPALASAARAAVMRRPRVVEKPALAPEIDSQISAIDHRLNELELLVDSIEKCLAGFEPLRERGEEEAMIGSEAA